MTLLLSLLAAKGLGALVGTIILLTRTVPGFEDPALLARGDTLYLETTLRHGFNRNLDQIINSGSPVAVAYTVTLLTRDASGTVRSAEPRSFVHSTAYDPVEQRYAVFRSELSGMEDSLVTVETQVQAKRLLARVAAPVLLPPLPPRGIEVSCRIEAALNTITLEAMDSRELDLNTFWNFRYPRAATGWMEAVTQ